jgi:hypothetical protein
MKLCEIESWKTDTKVDSEYRSLALLLTDLTNIASNVEFNPIDDLDTELGIEVFSGNVKIAEVYCAENRDGFIEGLYQVHCSRNWNESLILSRRDAARNIDKCANEINM